MSGLIAKIATANLDMHSLLVVRHATIVLDVLFFPYDGTRPHDIASCTKSLTSTAVGVAVGSGRIGLSTPVLSFFSGRAIANVDPRKSAMKIRHALSMTAGLTCASEQADVQAMQASSDLVGFALDLPMVDSPGASWRYCGSVSHLLSGVVTAATGQSEADLLTGQIFSAIGSRDIVWPADAQGISHGWGDARLWPEDLARIGLLFLHRGHWASDQLLASSWVDEATTNQVGTLGPSRGYGFQWWPYSDGTFYANGRGGQYLFVDQEHDLIAVTTGASSPEQSAAYEQVLGGDLLPAIISNDPLPSNPAGVAELTSATAAAALPPTATTPATPPATAAAAAGRIYTSSTNGFGWNQLVLSFAETVATLDLIVGDSPTHLAIGLDGIPRITRGVRFTTDPRHDDTDVAMVGRWSDDATFTVGFDTIDRIDAGTLTFTFTSGGIDVDVYEKTFLLTHLGFHAASA